MKIVAILQARTSSSRLPGKVLKPLMGQPMLLRQIERTRRARSLSGLLVATSVDASDDPLATLCEQNGVGVFRGALDDVLDRFYKAAVGADPDHVVRLTGDCPLADPDLIDLTVDHHIRGGFDYTSNCLEPTYPDGLDCEVMTLGALETAWRKADRPSEREHVTPYLYARPGRFKVGIVRGERDLSALRWTVDEPVDFEFVTRVYEELWQGNPDFGWDDVLALLERQPRLAALNAGHKRNEGYSKSLLKDRRP